MGHPGMCWTKLQLNCEEAERKTFVIAGSGKTLVVDGEYAGIYYYLRMPARTAYGLWYTVVLFYPPLGSSVYVRGFCTIVLHDCRSTLER